MADAGAGEPSMRAGGRATEGGMDFQAEVGVSSELEESADALLALTQANYQIQMPQGADISEVVVSTLPEGTSKWVADKLVERVAKSSGKPVEHIEVTEAVEA